MSVTANDLTLYYFPSCPFCQRVLVLMKENGIEIKSKNILNEAGARQELIQGGGSAQVPCLRIEQAAGDEWMYESLDIIHYLKKKS